MTGLARGAAAALTAQAARFGAVGAAAFAIDFGAMVLLTEALGLQPVLSATISFALSTLFNYAASMRFVFARRGDTGRGRELAAFTALSVVGLLLTDAVVQAATACAGMDYRPAKMLATAAVAVWNFGSRKAFLEAR